MRYTKPKTKIVTGSKAIQQIGSNRLNSTMLVKLMYRKFHAEYRKVRFLDH